MRGPNGSPLIFNDDIGSGWRIGGRAPSDDYLLSRRDVATPYDDLIRYHASKEGVDAGLVKSVMLVESNYNPRAVSRKGARGLMQLMPQTAAQLGVNPFDIGENIRGGVRYLSELLSTFQGNLTHALAAYNAGPGAVLKHGGVPPYAETHEYVRRTLLVYGSSGRSPSLLTGGFRGMETNPPPPIAAPPSRPARPRLQLARSEPVKLVRNAGALLLSNGPLVPRTAPLLGRVAPGGQRLSR